MTVRKIDCIVTVRLEIGIIHTSLSFLSSFALIQYTNLRIPIINFTPHQKIPGVSDFIPFSSIGQQGNWEHDVNDDLWEVEPGWV
ncbi:hypothetical protein L6164_023164 [Bauhinia variegata]|uniref:Uncharacterized protein n=1 Tax=Bauhinia variegata TaxID=167791 RepID=A0ACB9MJA3_BAUVA|nr:hypothetical protein L6164_023164 [Bauhinia variegata]